MSFGIERDHLHRLVAWVTVWRTIYVLHDFRFYRFKGERVA